MRKKILIIDDEPAMLEVLREHLQRKHDVETAPDGTKGLTAFAARRPDVVFLDVMMPGLTGLEVLKKIKTLHPELPVIVMTASDRVATAIEAHEQGVFSFLPKPFDFRYVDHLISMLPA